MKITNSIWKEIKIFFILLIPSIISIYWHFSNTQLPFADAANYLTAAIYIYHDIYIAYNVCVWYVCTLCPSSSPRLLLRQAATMHRRMRVCGC